MLAARPVAGKRALDRTGQPAGRPLKQPGMKAAIRHPNSLAARVRGPDRLLGPTILAAAGLLVAGWTLPLMTVEKLLVLTDRVSLLQGAGELLAGGHYLLFAVVVLFAVVFPMGKLTISLYLWYRADVTRPATLRTLDWLDALGRWSMLDVFVVALAVVALQISLVSDVALHAGLYLFTGAVVLSMLVVRRLLALARRASRESSAEAQR